MAKRSALRGFFRMFPDDEACLRYLFERRFGQGCECPTCGRASRWRRIGAERAYSCQWCGHHIHPTAGTILERTRTPLIEWFYVMFRFTEPGGYVSAKRLMLEVGCSYKSALRMRRVVRRLVSELDQEASTESGIEPGGAGKTVWGD